MLLQWPHLSLCSSDSELCHGVALQTHTTTTFCVFARPYDTLRRLSLFAGDGGGSSKRQLPLCLPRPPPPGSAAARPQRAAPGGDEPEWRHCPSAHPTAAPWPHASLGEDPVHRRRPAASKDGAGQGETERRKEGRDGWVRGSGGEGEMEEVEL